MTRSDIAIVTGYRTGAFARCIGLHARFYAAAAGFGQSFETRIAAGLSEFSGRLARPCNRIWLALRGERILGTLVIDGEDLGEGKGHLRWFILADEARGLGIGRLMLGQAVAFCDASTFAETRFLDFCRP
jgi:GNAT superfamily N-acetyltransferase